MRPAVRSSIIATLFAAIPSFLFAQPTQPATSPTTEPTSEPTTQPSTLPTTAPTTQPATKPTVSPATAPAVPEIKPTAMTGTPEGTFFPEQEGRLQQSKTSPYIQFIFERDGKLMEVPLLQNLELMRLENAVQASGWNMRFRASGWVTEYHGLNYVLLDHAAAIDPMRSDTTEPVR